MLHTGIEPTWTFFQAAAAWLESRNFQGARRSRYVAPRTLQDFQQYIRALNRFFEKIILVEIHIGHVREYQRLRSLGKLGPTPEEIKLYGWEGKKLADPREVGPNKINQELAILIRILQRAGCWTSEFEDLYEPLKHEDSEIVRALTPQEQNHWLATANSQEEWQLVYLYSLAAFRTTCRGCEMRHFRIGDVNLFAETASIRPTGAGGSTKTIGSMRTVPLLEDAVWAFQRLIDRFRFITGMEAQPHFYLLPIMNARGSYDPTRPMSDSGLKKHWNEVRLASGLLAFRPHDCRHTGITRLAEAGTPIPVIQSISGHMTERMVQHYMQVSEQAKMKAMQAAAFGGNYHVPRKHPRRAVEGVENQGLTALGAPVKIFAKGY